MLRNYWFTALICIDSSMLSGMMLALAIQYMHPARFKPLYRTSAESALLACSFTLLLAQATMALLWDMWHDNTHAFAQFPLLWRMGLSLPALLLANVALAKRAVRIELRHE